jgi:hypothetical protein
LIIINGRKLTRNEYKETTGDFWPWNQNLILENSLKGGGKIEDEMTTQVVMIYQEISRKVKSSILNEDVIMLVITKELGFMKVLNKVNVYN